MHAIHLICLTLHASNCAYKLERAISIVYYGMKAISKLLIFM